MVALTIYFLAGLPNVVNAVFRTVPASRRLRARVIGDEILTQVGRYMLGSALNASIAGLATFVWTAILGIPYPAALGLMVALMDMVPVIGSTIGGAIVTLVALSVSMPVAVATLAFYVAFRLTEDYLLLPKVMRHAVNVPPIVDRRRGADRRRADGDHRRVAGDSDRRRAQARRAGGATPPARASLNR